MKKLQESLTWDDFSDPESDTIEKEFLPREGEGDSFISQAVTATVKLIYKWFNDGDVFDNTHGLEGWANDLSDYANWLDEYVDEAYDILFRIKSISTEDEYTQLLYDLMHAILNQNFVNKHEGEPKIGTIYDCHGPYKFKSTDSYEDDYNDEGWDSKGTWEEDDARYW